MKKWEAKSKEDIILQKYWSKVGEQLYVEVPIGGPGGNGDWPPDCAIRRIDGVRLSNCSNKNGIYNFKESKDNFLNLINECSVELIEVKQKLNRLVIGQVIAGVDMFERQYKVKPHRLVILCAKGDSALEWVCEKRGISVEIETLVEE
jgi:hypothetical protein